MTDFCISLDELAAIAARVETPVVDIEFQCEETDDAALVEVGSEDSTAIVYYERDFDDFDAEVEALVATARMARERWNATAYRGRLAYRWTLFALAILVFVLVGFVFGRGLLDVTSLLSLGALGPLGGGLGGERRGTPQHILDRLYRLDTEQTYICCMCEKEYDSYDSMTACLDGHPDEDF